MTKLERWVNRHPYLILWIFFILWIISSTSDFKMATM